MESAAVPELTAERDDEEDIAGVWFRVGQAVKRWTTRRPREQKDGRSEVPNLMGCGRSIVQPSGRRDKICVGVIQGQGRTACEQRR
jgi:hypothetical protein